jgi:hypothetical protein
MVSENLHRGRYTSIYSRVPNRFSFILVISNIPFETDMDDVYRATAERNLMVSQYKGYAWNSISRQD